MILAVIVGFFIKLPVIHSVTAGLLISILGQLGDLSESMLKRDVGIKESGTVFPGHGGVLDRIDSFILAAPVFYYYLVWVLLR